MLHSAPAILNSRLDLEVNRMVMENFAKEKITYLNSYEVNIL